MYHIYLIKNFLNATIVACFDFSAKYTELGLFYAVSIEIGRVLIMFFLHTARRAERV